MPTFGDVKGLKFKHFCQFKLIFMGNRPNKNKNYGRALDLSRNQS